MATTLAKSLPSIRSHSIEVKMAKASIDRNSSEKSADTPTILELVSLALDRAGYANNHKRAAIEMGRDPADLSRALRGEGRLGIADLDRLPPAFWAELLVLIGNATRITPASRRRVALARLLEATAQVVEVLDEPVAVNE
jgi:hypothetical protein